MCRHGINKVTFHVGEDHQVEFNLDDAEFNFEFEGMNPREVQELGRINHFLNEFKVEEANDGVIGFPSR